MTTDDLERTPLADDATEFYLVDGVTWGTRRYVVIKVTPKTVTGSEEGRIGALYRRRFPRDDARVFATLGDARKGYLRMCMAMLDRLARSADQVRSYMLKFGVLPEGPPQQGIALEDCPGRSDGGKCYRSTDCPDCRGKVSGHE